MNEDDDLDDDGEPLNECSDDDDSDDDVRALCLLNSYILSIIPICLIDSNTHIATIIV